MKKYNPGILFSPVLLLAGVICLLNTGGFFGDHGTQHIFGYPSGIDAKKCHIKEILPLDEGLDTPFFQGHDSHRDKPHFIGHFDPSFTSVRQPTPMMAFGRYFFTILLMNDDPGTIKMR